MSEPLYIKIKDQDNVAIAVKDIKAGTEVMDGVIAHQDIPPRPIRLPCATLKREGRSSATG